MGKDKNFKYAVAYARVSTDDQARKDLSVPAQFRRIEEFAAENNIIIVFRDADEGVSAFKDRANREGFNRTIERACQDSRVSLFLIDDTERFYRDKYLSGETKARLRRNGVWVLITSDPYDPQTVDGVWRESIGDALAQTSSMKTAFYTFRGMEENAQKRDHVTGYCFKNGGRAPFGYRAVHVVRGQDRRGRDIVKTLWEIDEEAAEVMRFIYLNCQLNQQLSYKATRDVINKAGLLSPTPGRSWTISSIIEMLREDRVLQNAGVYFWNKEDHRTPGRRFKDRSEWIRVDNAHPGIISIEDAMSIVAMRTLNKGKDMSNRRSDNSPFLLTGKNIQNEDMFVCTKCGARMTGHTPSRRHRPCYVCGNVRYRGSESCISHHIDQKWVERLLISKIRECFGTKEIAAEIAKRINDRLFSNNQFDKEKSRINKKIQSIDTKISNLVRAVSNGIDINIVKPELELLKAERLKCELEVNRIEREQGMNHKPVKTEDVQRAYRKFEEAFEATDNYKKRKVLRLFVRKLLYDPVLDNLKVILFAEPLSLCHLNGAQDRT